jgi:phospholipid N-methyltransferase
LQFVREALREFEVTGSIFPTSRWAAEALAKPLENRNTPKKILELGPGNGSVTVKILDQMIDGDELLICEINPRLVDLLKIRLSRSKIFQKRKKQIRFFCGPAQELPTDTKFDVIICALPFLNFDLKTVKDIFGKIMEIRSPGAMMTYYEYIGIRPISLALSSPKRKQRMKDIHQFFNRLYREHEVKRDDVWLNVLPIHIYNVDLTQ